MPPVGRVQGGVSGSLLLPEPTGERNRGDSFEAGLTALDPKTWRPRPAGLQATLLAGPSSSEQIAAETGLQLASGPSRQAFRLRTGGNVSNLTQRCLPEGARWTTSRRRSLCEPRGCCTERTPGTDALADFGVLPLVGDAIRMSQLSSEPDTAEQTQLSRLCCRDSR